MAKRKTIAVMGATGAQGGGLVRAILNDPAGRFAARAITRDVNSDKARALRDLGAEVVAADLDRPESLVEAFEEAYGAFCITSYWAHFSPEKELAHARAMAEAVREAGVEHVIWSTLEDTRDWVPLKDERMPTLMGRYKVPHYDAKGEANRFFVDTGVPTTFLLTSFYWDNLIFFGLHPRRGSDGRLSITMPMGDRRLPGIAAEDIGKCAYGIYTRGDTYIGKTVGIAGGHLTGKEMVDAMSEALGEEVYYNDVSPDVYRSFDFPGADDVGNMFQFKRDFNEYYCAARDLDETRALNPALQSFSEWLTANWDRIPIEDA